jgi:peptide/nickel transport system permease protein
VTHYIIQRLLLAIPTLFGVTLLVFLVLRVLVPGDAVDVILADVLQQDPRVERQIRQQYGLSSSLPQQYTRWIANVAHGDLGRSYFTGRPVASELESRIPVTVELGLMALIFAWGLGVPVGVISAMRQDTAVDYVFRVPSILLLAIPNLWIALLVLTFGARWFGWAPPIRYATIFENPRQHLELMVPAAVILGAALSASVMRFTRAAMLEVLRQDYIRTATSKGLRMRAILIRHALRNVAVPLVTVLGGEVATILGGTVIIETIFGIPGVGRYYVDSFNVRDYPVAQGVNLVLACAVVLINVVVDLSYGIIDPRIRYS